MAVRRGAAQRRQRLRRQHALSEDIGTFGGESRRAGGGPGAPPTPARGAGPPPGAGGAGAGGRGAPGGGGGGGGACCLCAAARAVLPVQCCSAVRAWCRLLRSGPCSAAARCVRGAARAQTGHPSRARCCHGCVPNRRALPYPAPSRGQGEVLLFHLSLVDQSLYSQVVCPALPCPAHLCSSVQAKRYYYFIVRLVDQEPAGFVRPFSK